MRFTLALHEFARTSYRMILSSNRSLFCLLLLFAGVTVRGQIVLDNYNTANPLKIMPVDDSITDDCVVQGAWRKPLQPLLEANGFPFRGARDFRRGCRVHEAPARRSLRRGGRCSRPFRRRA